MSYESTVRLFAAQAMSGQPPIAGPVAVGLHIDVQIPASWSKAKRDRAIKAVERPTTKPDIDNVTKAIFDAINGVVWNDDVQVVTMHASKRYSETPGVTVIVREVTCKSA